MDAKTLKALKASIEHWRENAAREDIENIRIGPDQCALCGLFNTDITVRGDRCKGCPVAEHTGRASCNNTPYPEVDLCRWIVRKSNPTDREKARADLRSACNAELAFLESLLPVSRKGAQS